jgi:CRISPR-associated protein Csm2
MNSPRHPGGPGQRSPGGSPRYEGPRGAGRRDDAPSIDTSKIVFGKEASPKLYSDVAEACAQTVAQSPKEVNSGTQLRRFYDELVMLQQKVGRDATAFTDHAPFIEMLKAKVAYARGRNKVDANFERLVRALVDNVRDPDTLRQAKLFLEAFMAYYKGCKPN